MRKTVEVEYLIEKVNYFLANSEPEQKGERLGASGVLELALFKSNRYKGFRYLDPNFTTNSGMDESRREYYA
jgi:hypothetical protein